MSRLQLALNVDDLEALPGGVVEDPVTPRFSRSRIPASCSSLRW